MCQLYHLPLPLLFSPLKLLQRYPPILLQRSLQLHPQQYQHLCLLRVPLLIQAPFHLRSRQILRHRCLLQYQPAFLPSIRRLRHHIPLHWHQPRVPLRFQPLYPQQCLAPHRPRVPLLFQPLRLQQCLAPYQPRVLLRFQPHFQVPLQLRCRLFDRPPSLPLIRPHNPLLASLPLLLHLPLQVNQAGAQRRHQPVPL